MSGGVPALDADIRHRIAVAGPMPLAEFMGLCLGHPQHGYYMVRDPFGRGGDFITAPEISQMFGEMAGLWAAATWQLIGSPDKVQLIELGPGRGTMMADALRAAKVIPAFRSAVSVQLVETSPALRERQRQTLAGLDVPIDWHGSVTDMPEGPAIILANEFFDALPVNQAIKQADGWHERRIDIGPDGEFAFVLAPEPIRRFELTLPAAVRDAEIGAIYEWRSDHMAMELARRAANHGGAALIIDYGHISSATGDTFQAVRGHRFANPLIAPGEQDLTAHVDFQALAGAAESIGACVHGPVEQATFLRRLGIDARAAMLARGAPERAADIEAALARLTGGGATGMGTMFKALALTAPGIAGLPGFDP